MGGTSLIRRVLRLRNWHVCWAQCRTCEALQAQPHACGWLVSAVRRSITYHLIAEPRESNTAEPVGHTSHELTLKCIHRCPLVLSSAHTAAATITTTTRLGRGVPRTLAYSVSWCVWLLGDAFAAFSGFSLFPFSNFFEFLYCFSFSKFFCVLSVFPISINYSENK